MPGGKDEPVEVLERPAPHDGWLRYQRVAQVRKAERARMDKRDAEIRRQWAENDEHNLTTLALMFGLSREQIRKIIHGSRTKVPDLRQGQPPTP